MSEPAAAQETSRQQGGKQQKKAVVGAEGAGFGGGLGSGLAPLAPLGSKRKAPGGAAEWLAGGGKAAGGKGDNSVPSAIRDGGGSGDGQQPPLLVDKDGIPRLDSIRWDRPEAGFVMEKKIWAQI